MGSLRKAFIGNTILRRLLICFLVSTLLPTILITFFLCLRFDRNYRETAESQIAISRNLITAYLDIFRDEIDKITFAPYYHSYFSSNKSFDPDEKNYQTKLNNFQSEMQNLMNVTQLTYSNIRDLVIYSDEQLLYYPFIYNEYRYFRNNMELKEQEWYQHALEGNGKTVYSTSGTHSSDENSFIDVSSFYAARKIRNIRQPEQINVILLNLQSKEFETRLKEIDLLYDSFVVITNEKQELIYSSRPLTADALAMIQTGKQFHYDGSLWNCQAAPDHDLPLNAAIVYSLDDIGRNTRAMIYSAVGIYLIGIAVAMILFYSFNRWIVKSTASIQNTFAELEKGNLDARCPKVEVQEFDEIGSSLNEVIVRLDEKIKTEYVLKLQQKSLQLSALQSQIQPHFLINTIYCFIALNQIGETRKLNDGFYSLAHLLRYVLKKQSLATLGQECDFLEDYLKLQQLRFVDRLTYAIKCPENCRQIMIPKLILQPLVENAVIHGIEPSEKPCFCNVFIELDQTRLNILVEDNGVGFDAAEIEKILTGPDSSENANAEPSATVGLPYVKQCLLLRHPNAELHISRTDTTRIDIYIPREELTYEDPDR